MRKSSPRQLAIIIALITSVITVGGGIIIIIIKESNIFVSILFIALLVFFSVFIIVFYSLNNFIFEKIKPIYKTIQQINYEEDKLRSNLEEDDIIQDVQNDVMVWAKKKTREITQLRQLEKYRREFLGNVSHELKTPIFNIQGYILTLLDGGLEDKKINRKYLERTEKSVNRLISIVNDLESISRMESGELKLEYINFNIVKLVEEIIDEQEQFAKDRNIKVKLERNFDKSVMVHADRKRIYEVIKNLIVNSIIYGKEGGHSLISFMDMEEYIMVEISDNGVGMSEKDLPRIFERFFRTDKSRSREMGGTGLGLSIVKHILEAHNQTINVQSKIDQGSTFAFTLEKGSK
ncbi:MAG: sensor histidine kinase [Bacteroidales bacterium]|nr:sensor histidine kinase [Bacteroidales bacterium]